MKIFTEVSSVINANFLTGIQRTVIEIVSRLIADYKDNFVLLFSNKRGTYHRVYNYSFLQKFYFSDDEYPLSISEKNITIDDMTGDTVFLELDAAWQALERRNHLYPKLKKRNIRICSYVYDIIPITHPQFTSIGNLIYYPQYIGAILSFSDVIMTSAAYTVGEMKKLRDRIGLTNNDNSFAVVPLGADFIDCSTEDADDMISKEAKDIVSKGKYILFVSTIEPRKNHKVLLDAFQKELQNEDVNLVFVGRYGWNIDDIKSRIENSPLLGRTLFHLSNISNETLIFLYQNAFLVTFPSLVEGYGLPAIEALHYNAPVILSDTPVFHEIGGEYCDYFDPSDSLSFSNLVKKYLNNPSYYALKKKQTTEFKHPLWATAADKIKEICNSLMMSDESLQKINLRQMLCISARPEDLLASLPYYEHYMPFLSELLLICPEFVKIELLQKYSGKIKIKYITDDELLNGEHLPDDHTHRNFLLRCFAMRRQELDEYFIMTDDDYRPVLPIEEDFYLHNGRMQGYYCFDLDTWGDTVYRPTSFDKSMDRTNLFLKTNGMQNLMYASHMPQIISKKLYLKMLDDYPGIERNGFCEWSTYFNYIVSFYPNLISVHPYTTIAFPGNVSDWDQEVFPNQYLFENHYSSLYADGIFSGINEKFSPGVEDDNSERIIRERIRTEKHVSDIEASEQFRLDYTKKYREYPSVVFNSETRMFTLPRFLKFKRDSWNRIPVTVVGEPTGEIGWSYNKQRPVFVMPVYNKKIIYLPFRCVGDQNATVITFYSSDEKNKMIARNDVKLFIS